MGGGVTSMTLPPGLCPHIHSRLLPVIPAASRHSRESGNPHHALSTRRDIPGFWIPAYAGMTVGGGLDDVRRRGVDSRFRGNDGMGRWNERRRAAGEIGGGRRSWRRMGVSPSPNPLPLGEGFSLGGGLGFVAIGRGFVMRGRGARPCAPTIGGNQLHRQPSYPIRPPGAGPLPAGEGWVREKRPAPPNPGRNPNSRLIPSFPPSTVIPAKAGIHTPALSPLRYRPGFWIPAYAGMTVAGGCACCDGPGVDSRFRGNDGMGTGMTVGGGNDGRGRE